MITQLLQRILCLIERIYCLGFRLVTAYKRWRGNKGPFPFKIISVGNLSTGGTGKSVVVPFLANLLGKEHVAIALRGYKGSVSHSGQSGLVADGQTIFLTKDQCGDEAMMYALQEKIPIVVGKNRAQSCALLQRWAQVQHKKITYVILDDAYQNFDVKKDLEILLLDARAPFDNGHCLPAGMLREKDCTRADLIILTHADAVDEQARQHIKHSLLAKFPPAHIFMGAHAPSGIFHLNEKEVDVTTLAEKKFLLTAGVGSFKGVLNTAQRAGIQIHGIKEYSDHYAYTISDLEQLFAKMYDFGCDGIVTTAKDWVKMQPLLSQWSDWQRLPIFVIRVGFEFLSDQEYDNFVIAMKERETNLA